MIEHPSQYTVRRYSIAMKNISISMLAVIFLLLSVVPTANAAAGDALVVTSSVANVREGPGIDFPTIMKVPRGGVVIERSRQEDWVEIEVSGDGLRGWINAALLAQTTTKPAPTGKKSPAAQMIGDTPSSVRVDTLADSIKKRDAGIAAVKSQPVKQSITKAGVVDIQRIIDESIDGKRTKKHFADLAASTPPEELSKTEQQLVRQVIEKIVVIVAQYARQEGFTHVFDAPKSGLVFTDARFDITDQIIKRYDQQASAAPAEQGEKKSGNAEAPPPTKNK